MCETYALRMRLQEDSPDKGVKTIFANGSSAVFRTHEYSHENYYFTLAIPVGSLVDVKRTDSLYKHDSVWTYENFLQHVVDSFYNHHFYHTIVAVLVKLEIISDRQRVDCNILQFRNGNSIFNNNSKEYATFTLAISTSKYFPVLEFPVISLILCCMEDFISIFKEYYYNSPKIELEKINSMLEIYSENLFARLESTGLIESRLESIQKV